MGEVSTIGLDIAKSVFQVHGVDVAGSVVIRKRVSRANSRRKTPCRITSAAKTSVRRFALQAQHVRNAQICIGRSFALLAI
jgi:hypothetical protein